MPNKFLLVENHGGYYLPIDQNAIKTAYERIYHRPFDGACAGVVAGFLDNIFGYIQFNLHFYSKPDFRKCFLPSPAKSITLQADYERIEDFFSIFIRDTLSFPTGDAEERGYKSLQEILNNIDPKSRTNDIFLINVIFKLEVEKCTYRQDHKMCILKFHNQYMFCEPNYGLAIFNSLDKLKSWLDDEISNGSLKHFVKPVSKRMFVSDNKETISGLQQGLLSAESVYFEHFSKPLMHGLDFVNAAQFRPRL